MNQIHPISSPSKRARPQTNREAKDNIWSSLLDSVASAKRLPEKNLLILGKPVQYARYDHELNDFQVGHQRSKENF